MLYFCKNKRTTEILNAETRLTNACYNYPRLTSLKYVCTNSEPEAVVWCGTALASMVLPVPEGPYSSTTHGVSMVAQLPPEFLVFGYHIPQCPEHNQNRANCYWLSFMCETTAVSKKDTGSIKGKVSVMLCTQFSANILTILVNLNDRRIRTRLKANHCMGIQMLK